MVRLNLPGWVAIGWVICLGMASAEPLPLVRIGVVGYVGDATNYIALDRGYFEQEGIRVESRKNPAGLHSLRQIIRGELDIGAVAPTPIIYSTMGRFDEAPDFRIVASILESTSLNNLVILDTDAIPGPGHLSGKRLALTKGSASEYFWYVFALAQGIDPNGPVIEHLQVPKMAEAAKSGKIDAAIAWTPFHLDIMVAVETPAASYSGEDIYTTSWLVVARPDYIERHPERVRAYLRALLRAEADINRAPAEAAVVHARYTNSTPEQLVAHYPLLEFNLALSESLVVNLSQQALWAQQRGYVVGEIPDFRNYINQLPLKEISPGSIKLLE